MKEYGATYSFNLELDFEEENLTAIEELFESAMNEIYDNFQKSMKKFKAQTEFYGNLVHYESDEDDDDHYEDIKLGLDKGD